MSSKRRVSFGPLESSANYELFAEPATLTAPSAPSVVSTTTISTVVPPNVTAVVRDVNEYTLHNFKLRGYTATDAKLMLHCPLTATLNDGELLAMTFDQHLDAAINGALASSVSLHVRALLEAHRMRYALYIAAGVYIAFNIAEWRTVGTHLDHQTYWSNKFPTKRAEMTRIFGPAEADQAGAFTAPSAWMTHEDTAQKVADALLAGTLTEAQLTALKIASYKDRQEGVARQYGLTISRRSNTDRWMRTVTRGASPVAPAELVLVADEKSKPSAVPKKGKAAAATPKQKKAAKKRALDNASNSDDEEGGETWQPDAKDEPTPATTTMKSTIQMSDLYSPAMFGDEFDYTVSKKARVETASDGELATNNLLNVLSTDTDDDLLPGLGAMQDQWLVNNMLSASLGFEDVPSIESLCSALDVPDVVVVQRQPLREALVQRVLDAPAGTPLAMLALNQQARFARDAKSRRCAIDVRLDTVDANTRSVLTGNDGDLCAKWAAGVDSVIEKMILADGRLPSTYGAGVTQEQYAFAARQFGYSAAQLNARRAVE